MKQPFDEASPSRRPPQSLANVLRALPLREQDLAYDPLGPERVGPAAHAPRARRGRTLDDRDEQG